MGILLYLHDARMMGLLLIVWGIHRGWYCAKIHMRLTNEGITYFHSFNLFSNPKKISWNNIQKAETGVKVLSAFTALYFTRLYGKEKGEVLEINIKWMSKENVRLFGVALQEKTQNADLDEATQDLARGYVPSFVVGKTKPWG
jgi:hypothetical protein